MKGWLFLLTSTALCLHTQGCDNATIMWKSFEKYLDLQNFEKMIAPNVSFDQNDDLESIYKMLLEMDALHDDFSGGLAAEFAVLRQVEQQSLNLMAYLEDAYATTDSISFTQQIKTFLEKCNEYHNEPYESIVSSNVIEKVIRTATNKTFAIHKIFSSIHRMAIVSLFQQKLQVSFLGGNKQNAETSIMRVGNGLKVIRRETDKLLQDLCNTPTPGTPIRRYPICFPLVPTGRNCGGANPSDLTFEVDIENNITKPSTTSDAGDDEKEQLKLLFVKSALELLGEIPVAGTLARMLSPFVDSALGRADAEMIRNGFQQINTKIDEYKAQLHVQINLDTLRQVEKLADRLMQNLQDVYIETPPTNLTIATFLKECEKSDNDPYQNIMVMNTLVKKALRMQFESDSYYSRTGLERMEKRLYSTLNQLTIAFLFQQRYLRLSHVERRKNFEKFDRKMEEIQTETNKILVELKEPKYWENRSEFLKNVMSNVTTTADATTRSNRIKKYLFDVYTDDRFCVVTYNKKKDKTERTGWDKAFGLYPIINNITPLVIANNENLYENGEYKVMIIRSRSAHNISSTDEQTFKSMAHQIHFATKRDPFAREKAMPHDNPPFSAIVKIRQEEDVIVACSKGLSYSFDTQCSGWVTKEGVMFHDLYSIINDCYITVLPP